MGTKKSVPARPSVVVANVAALRAAVQRVLGKEGQLSECPFCLGWPPNGDVGVAVSVEVEPNVIAVRVVCNNSSCLAEGPRIVVSKDKAISPKAARATVSDAVWKWGRCF
jgi:hypothetical protein